MSRQGIAALVLSILAGAASAQMEGPEAELQRCVWGCLYRFGPAENPAYQQCVAEVCAELSEAVEQSDASAPPAPAPAVDEAWTAVTSLIDGTMARVPSGTATLYTLCDSRGARLGLAGGAFEERFVLSTPPAPAPWMIFFVVDGGAPFGVNFAPDGGSLGSPIAGQERLIEALKAGSSVQVVQGGDLLATFSLRGSARAFAEARCPG